MFNYIGLRDLVPRSLLIPSPAIWHHVIWLLLDSTRVPHLDQGQILIHQNPVRWTPPDYTKHISDMYVLCFLKVDNPVWQTPPDTHLSGLQSEFNFQSVQSGGLTGPLSLDNTQFYIPVDSSGLRRSQHVMICDKVGVRSNPAESSRVQQSPAEHVGECKVLPLVIEQTPGFLETLTLTEWLRVGVFKGKGRDTIEIPQGYPWQSLHVCNQWLSGIGVWKLILLCNFHSLKTTQSLLWANYI